MSYQDFMQLADRYLANRRAEQDAHDQVTERIFNLFDRAAKAELIRAIPELDGMEIEVSYQVGFRILADGHYPILLQANIPFTLDDDGRPTYNYDFPITFKSISIDDIPGVCFTPDQNLDINATFAGDNPDIQLAIGLALRYAELPKGVRLVGESM